MCLFGSLPPVTVHTTSTGCAGRTKPLLDHAGENICRMVQCALRVEARRKRNLSLGGRCSVRSPGDGCGRHAHSKRSCRQISGLKQRQHQAHNFPSCRCLEPKRLWHQSNNSIRYQANQKHRPRSATGTSLQSRRWSLSWMETYSPSMV